MINKFETYGKRNFIQKTILTLKNRFKLNPYTEIALNERGLKGYIPKLNKTRFSLSMVGVVLCVVIPFITPLALFVLLWGIK